MKFEWIKKYEDDDGYWAGKFYNDEGNCVDKISLTDYTTGFLRKHAIELKNRMEDTFQIHWCNGWSMREELHTPEYNLEKAKRWCEKWLAERYIEAYENTIKRLEEMKKRHDFWKQYVKED